MPLDFPSSPTNGQEYNGYTYSTSVGAWQAKPAAQSPFYTSDTPPSNPVAGDSWFNTNDGTMYIYVNDGNTSQWVEHRSEIARSQVGLVPIVPTSIAVGSGTGTVSTTGLVTINGATSVTLNGVFTDTYKRYKIVIGGYSSSSEWLNFRLSNGGTPNSSSNYYFAGGYVNTSSMAFQGAATSAAYGRFGYAASDGFIVEGDFVGLRDTDRYARSSSRLGYGTIAETMYGNAYIVNATTFDGIQVFHATAANLNMTVKIYGYN